MKLTLKYIVFNPTYQNIIISTCNQYKKFIMRYSEMSCIKPSTWGVYFNITAHCNGN